MPTKPKSEPKTAPRFTDAERAAMRERAKELKAAQSSAEGEKDVLAKIAEMPDADRTLAERVHALAGATAPQLASKTYYGMPAYALEGKVVFWFKSAAKFGSRYATVGFSDRARLDEGDLWPTEYAVIKFNPGVEKKLEALIKRAVG